MMIRVGCFELDGTFLKMGKLEIFLERSVYKSLGLLGVMWERTPGVTRVVAMGMELTVCWGLPEMNRE